MATIFYIGDTTHGETSSHRANAIKRLGHEVITLDPYKAFTRELTSRFSGPLHFHTGYILLQKKIRNWAKSVLSVTPKPDLIWIDSGELFGPSCVQAMKDLNYPVVLYNIDDPTGTRDSRRFHSLIKALPYYDLVAVVRKETEAECWKLGAKAVMRVFRSYDEVEHRPFDRLDDIPEKFRSEVAFIGTFMKHEKRDEFLLKLISLGVPVSIWGYRWDKSPHLEKLKPYIRGGGMRGRDYVAAIQGAKLCLGFLSSGNRDLHTTRSLEVPYAGGLFCAKRTSEHQELYREGVEAIFWNDADECAAQCLRILNDDSLRENIRIAGMQRVRSLGLGNEDVCRKILNTLLK